MIGKLRRWLRWKMTRQAHRRRAPEDVDLQALWLILAIAVLLFLIYAVLLDRAATVGQL